MSRPGSAPALNFTANSAVITNHEFVPSHECPGAARSFIPARRFDSKVAGRQQQPLHEYVASGRHHFIELGGGGCQNRRSAKDMTFANEAQQVSDFSPFKGVTEAVFSAHCNKTNS